MNKSGEITSNTMIARFFNAAEERAHLKVVHLAVIKWQIRGALGNN